jgi:4-diphosphocytidyl-2-C-methyl-D-erythritol kinase
MSEVRLRAFAKVNLRLDVIGRRADGYHELRTIFQTISLHDTLRLDWNRGGGIELEVEGNAALASEPARSNLVYRALAAMRSELGIRRGLRARLQKSIPAGRGLGGGSSDAAAALLGVLRLTGRKIELGRLVEIASHLGSDVPFFLFGGRAAGLGRGEQILPLPDGPRLGVLVVSPRTISVPTRDAYSWLAASRAGRRGGLTNRAVASKLIKFCALCWSPQAGALSNDLSGPSSSGTRFWAVSSGNCFGVERRMLRWRVAVRRCLDCSETQRRRVEPPIGFRTKRFSSVPVSRGSRFAVVWANRP